MSELLEYGHKSLYLNASIGHLAGIKPASLRFRSSALTGPESQTQVSSSNRTFMYIYKSKGAAGWISARGLVVAFFTTALGQDS